MRLASVLAVSFVFGLGVGNAFAAKDLSHRLNMNKIIVGEKRYNEKFFGCIFREAAIDLSRRERGKNTRIDNIMDDKKAKEWFLERFGCRNYIVTTLFIVELLYKSNQDKGEFVEGNDHKLYFRTDEASILRVENKRGGEFFMLAHQLVERTPTRQNKIEAYFKLCEFRGQYT